MFLLPLTEFEFVTKQYNQYTNVILYDSISFCFPHCGLFNKCLEHLALSQYCNIKKLQKWNSTICLAVLASANEKKVPPRHLLQRLNRSSKIGYICSSRFLSAQNFYLISNPPRFQVLFWKLYFVEIKNENFRAVSFSEPFAKIGKLAAEKIGKSDSSIDQFW